MRVIDVSIADLEVTLAGRYVISQFTFSLRFPILRQWMWMRTWRFIGDFCSSADGRRNGMCSNSPHRLGTMTHLNIPSPRRVNPSKRMPD